MRKEAFEKVVAETQGQSVESLLVWLTERFGKRIAFASSLSVEDQVLTDMIARVARPLPIFTIDTGRLPEETYDLLEETRDRYSLAIEVLFPDPADIEPLVCDHGPNLFRCSVEARRLCCEVRKVKPLRRHLQGLDAWLTGLRREQATTRVALETAAWDETFGLGKFNPLAAWTAEQVWSYIREHDVPYNRLCDLGYRSIGCAPCTRAVRPGEDVRAGRWWWEKPEHKECGLHIVDGKDGGSGH